MIGHRSLNSTELQETLMNLLPIDGRILGERHLFAGADIGAAKAIA